MKTATQRICDWFASQCNGDWEHMHGITIETTDNPGWYVTIERVPISDWDSWGDGTNEFEVEGYTLFGYTSNPSGLEKLLDIIAGFIEEKGLTKSEGAV